MRSIFSLQTLARTTSAMALIAYAIPAHSQDRAPPSAGAPTSGTATGSSTDAQIGTASSAVAPGASTPSTTAGQVVTTGVPGEGTSAGTPGQQEVQQSDFADITVTARRVAENIQRVPIAISAFTPETLQNRDVKDVFDLTRSVGGLSIFGSPQTVSFVFLRGIGNGAPTYFADVPSTPSPYSSFFDVANVQVLKGPQGTLFGQASNAGAILYVPRRPSRTLGGYVTAIGGDYGRREVQAAIDVPVLDDRVLFRMAATTYHRNGYVIDDATRRDYGDQNYYVLRPSLVVQPVSWLENYTLFQFTKAHDNGNPGAGVLHDFNFSPTSKLAILGTQAAVNGLTRAQFDALRDQYLAQQIALGPYRSISYSTQCATPNGPQSGACPYDRSKNYFLANTTTLSPTDHLTIKNIFGRTWGNSFSQPGDGDDSPIRIGDGSARNGTSSIPINTQVSDEVQFQGHKLFDMVDLTVGYFYLHQHNSPRVIYGKNLGVADTASITKTSNSSQALYAQGNLDLRSLLEGLTFTAGYRKTWDTAHRLVTNLNPTTLAVTSISGGDNTPAGEAHFKAGSYTLSLQWQLNPRVLFFLTNAKGFGSGGLQNAIGFERFEPDSLNNLEGGTKATFNLFGMPTRVNASYFYGWFDNVKVSAARLVQQQPAPALPVSAVITINAAKAKISGVDSEMTIAPTDFLELGGTFAYIDAHYTSFPMLSPLTNMLVDASDTPFSFTPKYKWQARATVKLPIPENLGRLSMTGTASFQSQLQHGTLPYTPLDPTNPNTGLTCYRVRSAANGYGPLSADGKKNYVLCTPHYYTFDLNVNWNRFLDRDGLNLSFFVTNIAKNKITEGGSLVDAAIGYTIRFTAAPRMFGFRVTQSF